MNEEKERIEFRLQQIEEWGHIRADGSRRCPDSWAPAEGEEEALEARLREIEITTVEKRILRLDILLTEARALRAEMNDTEATDENTSAYAVKLSEIIAQASQISIFVADALAGFTMSMWEQAVDPS